jgi:hypothetical protein
MNIPVSDKPIVEVDWGQVKPAEYTAVAAPESRDETERKPAKKRAKKQSAKAHDFESMSGKKSTSVILDASVYGKLCWVIPLQGSDDKREKRILAAAADIFDSSAHAYMARVVTEAIERDFKKVDKVWREKQ